MAVELYDSQKEVLNRLKNGSILYGDTGSGKSRTAIAYFHVLNGGSIDPYKDIPNDPLDLYIITTAGKRDKKEWEDELEPFQMAPSNTIYNHKIVIDSWNNIKKYSSVTGSFFIFDEQRVVGRGQWVKAFLKIAQHNKWILLSATPGDTWRDYIPVFIANGFYRNFTDFYNQHVIWKPFSNYPQIDRYVNTVKLIKYRNDILIRMKVDKHTVSHDQDILCGYDKYLYNRIRRDRWNVWEDKPIETASEVCYALRKVVNSDLSRQDAMLDICAVHPKAVVFYSFDYELDILKTLDYPEGTVVAQWNGHKHEPVPRYSDRWVYLVQYTAGAEGWNCTETDTLIFFSRNYSYKTTKQAKGRIDRTNTPFVDLYYFTLTSAAPIDKAIATALKSKKEFNERRYVDLMDKAAMRQQERSQYATEQSLQETGGTWVYRPGYAIRR